MKSIHGMISSPPVPGGNLSFLKQEKSYLLFDGEILRFLIIWKTLG